MRQLMFSVALNTAIMKSCLHDTNVLTTIYLAWELAGLYFEGTRSLDKDFIQKSTVRRKMQEEYFDTVSTSITKQYRDASMILFHLRFGLNVVSLELTGN
jgi:hypothetical protein